MCKMFTFLTLVILGTFWGLAAAFAAEPDPRLGDPELAKPFHFEFPDGNLTDSWDCATQTFDGNACLSSPSQVHAGPDGLTLTISRLEKMRQKRSWVAGGIMSKRLFSYGTFTVSMRSPIPSGTVSSFFLMNLWQPGSWLHKEIDFEFLGRGRDQVQTNIHRFRADKDSAAGLPEIWVAPFDYGQDFHEYAILWQPDKVEWFVDGKSVRLVTDKIPDEPLQILMNFWIPDPAFDWTRSWVGPLKAENLPAGAEYRWVRYEPWKG